MFKFSFIDMSPNQEISQQSVSWKINNKPCPSHNGFLASIEVKKFRNKEKLLIYTIP
jgi:hypothetical protein